MTDLNAAQWNRYHPVGTPVIAYPGFRPEYAAERGFEAKRLETRTRSIAWNLGHGTPVVMVEGYAGGISLEHIDLVEQQAATVYVVDGFTSYHVDRDCKALDSARIRGAMRTTTAGLIAATGRPACIVCAVPPGATEWTVTRANLGQLWELIGPSKPFVEFPADTDKPVTTGLTIRPHKDMPKQYATFGDRITVSRGRYTVHPATQDTES